MKLALVLLAALQTSAPMSSPAHSVQKLQGSHGVRNEQYGLFLRPRDASNKDGEPIVLYQYQPWKCMAWRFEDVADGTRLVNFFTSKSFEVQPSSSKALIQMPSSAEKAAEESVRFVPLDHGIYEITTKNGEALTAVGSDGHGDIRVVVAPWKNAASQRWQLVDIPEHFTM